MTLVTWYAENLFRRKSFYLRNTLFCQTIFNSSRCFKIILLSLAFNLTYFQSSWKSKGFCSLSIWSNVIFCFSIIIKVIGKLHFSFYDCWAHHCIIFCHSDHFVHLGIKYDDASLKCYCTITISWFNCWIMLLFLLFQMCVFLFGFWERWN